MAIKKVDVSSVLLFLLFRLLLFSVHPSVMTFWHQLPPPSISGRIGGGATACLGGSPTATILLPHPTCIPCSLFCACRPYRGHGHAFSRCPIRQRARRADLSLSLSLSHWHLFLAAKCCLGLFLISAVVLHYSICTRSGVF